MKSTLLHIKSFILYLLCVSLISCNENKTADQQKTKLTFWHFWSEPKQKKALYEIIEQFEKEHPDIDIQPTELQWSDGKSKLSLAFNSGTSPDVIHIGLEWLPEYSHAGVLLPLKSSGNNFPPIQSALRYKNLQYAIPWFVNTRALIIRRKAIENIPATWEEFTTILQQNSALRTFDYGIGINSDEPLNVSKKVLPWLWSAGSTIFRTYPLAQSIDNAAVEGLQYYYSLLKTGIMEKGRTLDELFIQNKIAVVHTGIWIIDNPLIAEHEHDYLVAKEIPHKINDIGGASILSGDCLSISAKSKNHKQAQKFITFISSYNQAKKFALSVPDVGFPADTAIKNDNDFNSSALRKGFLLQTVHSIPITSSVITAQAISIFEQEVMECLYNRKTPEETIKEIKRKVTELETSRK